MYTLVYVASGTRFVSFNALFLIACKTRAGGVCYSSMIYGPSFLPSLLHSFIHSFAYAFALSLCMIPTFRCELLLLLLFLDFPTLPPPENHFPCPNTSTGVFMTCLSCTVCTYVSKSLWVRANTEASMCENGPCTLSPVLLVVFELLCCCCYCCCG